MPDVWPTLLGIADMDVSDPAVLRDVLATDGQPDASQLSMVPASATALTAVRMLDLPNANVIVGPFADVSSPTPALRPLTNLSQQWLVAGWRQALDGKPDEAATQMLSVWQLSRLLIEGDSSLLVTALGINIERQALQELHELLRDNPTIQPETLAQIATALAQRHDVDLSRATATEWGVMARTIQTSQPDTLESLYIDRGRAPWKFACQYVRWVPNAYQPDQTLGWLWEDRHQMDAYVQAPRWERTDFVHVNRFHWSPYGPFQRSHFDELRKNPLGRAILQLLNPTGVMLQVVDQADQLQAKRVIFETWLAAQRHMHATGQVPTGDDLAPQWLAEIPTDPFDGQPVRITEDAVYSAGADAEEWQQAVLRDEDGRRTAATQPLPGLRLPLSPPP